MEWWQPVRTAVAGIRSGGRRNTRKARATRGFLAKPISEGSQSPSKTAFQNPNVRFININVAEFDAFKHSALPVVADARVFADKIARHPELLGVRGALQRSPGTK